LHIERGQTPIFEWCSKKQQIVISYPNDRLVLTAIRDINSGEYKSYQQMVSYANAYDVEVVQAYAGTVTNMENLVAETRGLQGQEGWVIRFDTGHMIKIKSSIYVNIHQAKDSLMRENALLEIMLDEKIDDIKSVLPETDRHALDIFETSFYKAVNKTASVWAVENKIIRIEYGNDRKKFAIEKAQFIDAHLRGCIFKAWDNPDHDWYQSVIDIIRKNLGSSTKLDEVRYLFGNVKWNYGSLPA
jgi:T4 RnlA family RNA ligase